MQMIAFASTEFIRVLFTGMKTGALRVSRLYLTRMCLFFCIFIFFHTAMEKQSFASGFAPQLAAPQTTW